MTDQEGTVTRAPDLERQEFVLPVPGQVLAGRFRLIRVLGAGASGTVFEAHDASIDQRVALKVLRGDLTDSTVRGRLQREVRAARHGHANIVTVYELHEEGGLVFLAMELVEGRSLRDLLAEKGTLGIEETITIGRQVAAALEHLHGLGLVHRDVKPGNILIAADGTAKLCDMGLARATDGDQTLTHSAAVLGTPAFMAPEQASGAVLGPPADIYALGLTLYQCLTGKVPLLEDSAVATGVKRQRSRPPRVHALQKDCPIWLDRLAHWMLEPSPTDRPTAECLVGAFDDERVRLRPNRKALAAAAAVLVLGIGVWITFVALAKPETVRVEVGEYSVSGVDDSGDVTWQHTLDQPIRQTLHTDLDEDGQDETIVAAFAGSYENHSRRAGAGTEVMIVSVDGRQRSRMNPNDLVPIWGYPFRRDLVVELRLLDVDRDGVTEVVAICPNRLTYPTMVAVLWPESFNWELILDHPGRISSARVAVVDGEPVLQLVAVNNRIGVQHVFGEIEITPPGDTELMSDALGAPDRSRDNIAERFRWRSYVLLESEVDRPDFAEGLADSDGTLRWPGGHLDQWRNPVPGPNEGRDLRLDRMQFLVQLEQLAVTNQPPDGFQTEKTIQEVASGFASLLEETPYGVAFALAASAALARVGDVDGAVEILRGFLSFDNKRNQNEDVVFRLAHLDALAGNYDVAAKNIRQLMARNRTTRGTFDGPYLLLAIGLETRDEAAVEMAIRRLQTKGKTYSSEGSSGVALRAWTHLWWDTLTASDTMVGSVPYAPAGDATACLARWRLGQTRPDDPGAMTRLSERYPEASIEARLARAAANLALDRPAEALADLEELTNELTSEAPLDFQKKQLWDLARALRLHALAASGGHVRSVDQARRLLPELTPGLLPEVLATETLHIP